MIIKSMSRKQPSFEQLYDYIVRDHDNDRAFNFTHNHFGTNRDDILDEFIQNAALLSKRKGCNYLYHEVISITRSKQLSEQQQKEYLRDIVQQYINERAKDNLVFAGLHDEKSNQLHYHLIISANAVQATRRHYFSQKKFDSIKRNVETYTLERYPELEQAKLITQDKSTRSTSQKSSNKEGEFKRRTGKKTQKEHMQDVLKDIFQQASTSQEFLQLLETNGIESYIRGKTIGFHNLDTNRKHRLTTLGLSEEYDEMHYRFTESAQQTNTSTGETMKKKQPDQDPIDTAREKVGDTLKEWVAGDFTERDKNHRRAQEKEPQQEPKKQESTKQHNETLEEKVIRQRKEQAEKRYSEKDRTKQQNRGKDKNLKR
ncbi:MAG: hypothetical protein AAGF06_06315 [Pseudomonadota bacterium]